MAMAPTPAAAPMPADAGAPMPDAGGAPDMGAADEGMEPEVIATISVNKDGTYVLTAGDEPEATEGDAPAAQGKTFDSPQALLRGVMELLNPMEGAEDSFAKGFKGEPDATASKPDMPPPGM